MIPAKDIVIIAGHGGVDPGAKSKFGMQEARVNLNVALELEKLLTASGFRVRQYRKSHDDFPGKSGTWIINNSMAFTRRYPGAISINIHHNAGGGYGAEVWARINHLPSAALGSAILDEFKALGQTVRGVKTRKGSNGDYFGVLRAAAGVGSTAVITEFGFMDTEDARDFDEPREQKAEAAAIAKAVKRLYKPA